MKFEFNSLIAFIGAVASFAWGGYPLGIQILVYFAIADYITFRYGKLETHFNGYGQVKSEKRTVLNVNYEMKKLDEYNEYLEKRRGSECFIEDFTIF